MILNKIFSFFGGALSKKRIEANYSFSLLALQAGGRKADEHVIYKSVLAKLQL